MITTRTEPMASKKLIVVIGATGNQGGSVVDAFKALPHWEIRAITRDPSSDNALSLQASGVEVCQADLGDVASLLEAFEGAHAIFVNTDFFSVLLPAYRNGTPWGEAGQLAYECGVQYVKNAANAAVAIPTLERFVYSALAPMSRGSGGKYDQALRWESRAAGVAYIESELPKLASKTSYIHCGAYMSNPFLIPQCDLSNGTFQMIRNSSSQARWPILDPRLSTGSFVRALVEDEEPKTRLLAYNSYHTLAETHQLWGKVTGKVAEFKQVTLADMQAYSGMAPEMLDEPACIDEFGYMPGIGKYVEPHQLKKPFERESFEAYLRRQSMKSLLTSRFPRFP